MFKVSINILDNKGNSNFTWTAKSDADVSRTQLLEAMLSQFRKAQNGAAAVVNGARIGRIKPTNRVTFDVQKFGDTWESIPVAENMAQLGNQRLFSKSGDVWVPNDFTAAIEFVLDVLDF